MRRPARALLLCWAAAAAVAAGSSLPPPKGKQPAVDRMPPLIPMEILLGPSKYRNVQLSPNGRYLSYARPSGAAGVYNIFVKPLPPQGSAHAPLPSDRRSLFEREGVENDLQVTFSERGGIQIASWTEDSQGLLFMQDREGDENDHVYLVRLAEALQTGAKRAPPAVDLTPFPGVKAVGLISSKQAPHLLYVGLNVIDPAVFDLYRIDLRTLAIELDTLNPGGVTRWLADSEFEIRAALVYNDTDGSSFLAVKDGPLPDESRRGARPGEEPTPQRVANGDRKSVV